MKKKLLLCFMIVLGLSVKGQNLHTQANAASILNEANATTGWTGNADITSSNVNPFQGNFSLSATSTGSTGNTRDMNYTFTAIVGQVYTISIWAREGNLSFQPAFANWTGFTGFSTTPIVGNNWSQYTWNLTAASTNPMIRVYTAPYNGGQVGSQVLIDNVSISVQDNTPPTAPSNLTASGTTTTTTDLSWTASTDNIGVTSYNVFQNGGIIGTTSGASNFNVTGLTENTTYNFTISASDAAGNTSGLSNTANITTLTADTEPPTVLIQGAPASVNTTAAFNVTLEFSEDVVGFELGDVVLSNATSSNFIAVDGNTYTVDITPNGAG
ncbi:Fibronectin type III domain-containing protein, partial [Arenibacter nanhaiticus]